jgi:hypothetical protein
MKMISNYLDSLESYLSDDLKQEVREELEASILEQVEDKQQELGRELNQLEQETLLKKLGHPMRVAAAYLPKQRLVGAEYFPAYKRALEIALAIVLGILILLSLPDIFNGRSIIGSAITIFAQMIDTGLYVFAIVTIIFYLMEYYGTSLDYIYAWSPGELKGYSRRLSLSRLESGFELIVYILFMAWWNDIITWPSDTWSDLQTTSLSFSQEWKGVFWSINIIMGLSLIVAFHKFAVASWTKISLVTDILLGLASLFVIYQITQFDQLVIFSGSEEIVNRWGKFIENLDNTVYSVLAIIAAICIWDIYHHIRKFIQG